MGVGVCPSGRMLSDLCRNPSNFKLSNPAECESPTEVKVCQPLQKKQQMAAGAALAAKRGKRPKSSLKGASKHNDYEVLSWGTKHLEDFQENLSWSLTS